MRIGGGDVDYSGLDDTSSDDDTDSSSDSDSSSTDSSYIVGRGEKDLDSGSAGNESADYNDRDENTTGGITRSQKQEGTVGNNDPDSGTAGNTDETPADQLAPPEDDADTSGDVTYMPGSSYEGEPEEWQEASTDDEGNSPGGSGAGTQDLTDDDRQDNDVAEWMQDTLEDTPLETEDGSPVVDDLDLPNMPGTDGDGDGVDLDGDGEGIGDEGLDDITDALNLDDINIPAPEVPGVDVPWLAVGAVVAVVGGIYVLGGSASTVGAATAASRAKDAAT